MALIGRAIGAAGSIYGGISASLVEAIIEALDIDYNGKQRSNVLAGDRSASQEREQGSPGDSTSGERGESGEQSADGTGGAVSSDNERRGQGNLQDTSRRQQDDLAQAGDVDENGHPFVKSSNGTTTFGYIKADSGLTPAPIKLSEGFNNKDKKGTTSAMDEFISTKVMADKSERRAMHQSKNLSKKSHAIIRKSALAVIEKATKHICCWNSMTRSTMPRCMWNCLVTESTGT